jgi:protocatechuate 3,4-dioxygenase beta subunit
MSTLSQFRQLTSRMIFACLLATLCSPAAYAAQSASAPQILSSSGAFRIAGTIVNAIGGNPLARARVSILDASNSQNRQSLVTSEDGRFEFKQLSPGKYALQGAKRGFITAAYDEHESFSTAIVTGAGFDTEHLVLRLSPSAVLSGKILDESGEPVRHASVSLYREDRQVGVGRIVKFRVAITDDLGAYEFAQLDAGSYFVSVAAQPWYASHPRSSQQPDAQNLPTAVDQSLDVAYPVTYYGDSTEPDDATPIPIRGGDRLQADVHLNAVAALHLLFHVPDNGEHGFSLPMFQKPSFDGVENVQTGGGDQVSPGVFEVTGIAPGRYSVRDPSDGQGNEANEIDITTNGQELEAPHAVALSSVKATVQALGGGATLPPHIDIGLRNVKMRFVAWQEADAKGEIEFQSLSPGTYDVLPFAMGLTPPKAFSVVRISSPGSETAGHTLNVAPGSSMTVTLSLIGSNGDVDGFAKHAGKAVSGAMVVSVPADPESHRELFRRDQSDQDGSFSLRSVLPGTYTIVAIENGWDLDWSRPGVIAHYAKQAQTVTVTEHSPTSIHLVDPVEVQSR